MFNDYFVFFGRYLLL